MKKMIVMQNESDVHASRDHGLDYLCEFISMKRFMEYCMHVSSVHINVILFIGYLIIYDHY